MNQLRQKNVRNIPASGYFAPLKGTTTTINDGLLSRDGTSDEIWFEGDFTAANGPTFADMPFDIRNFSDADTYRAHLKRTSMYGSVFSQWPSPNATYILKDELTMFIAPKIVQPMVPDSSRTYNYTSHSGSYMPPFFKWSRTLMYRCTDTYIFAYWSDWFLEGNGDRPLSPRLINNAGSWTYLIDPRLSKTWAIPNYNPSYPLAVLGGANGIAFGLVVVNFVTPAVSGTPNVWLLGGTAAWTKAFSVTANRSSRLLIDGTGINMPTFLTGVNSA